MKKFWKTCSIILAILFIAGYMYAQEPQKEFFAGRRTELLTKMKEGILVLAAGKTQPGRNSDMPFKQDDNFYYLTGYTTQDAICMFVPKAANKYILFVKKGYSYQRSGAVQKNYLKEIMQTYGADTAYYVNDFEKVFKRYCII